MNEETKKELTTNEVKAQVEKVLDSFKAQYRQASAKHSLKRSPFLSLKEKGYLTADKVMAEFDAIQKKRSSLSSGERDVIKKFVYTALQQIAIRRLRNCRSRSMRMNQVYKH